MKRPVRYILGGLLAVLGFSSCSALREAREARAEREREAIRQQQMALKDQVLQEMLEADENDPEFQAQQAKLREAERQRLLREQEWSAPSSSTPSRTFPTGRSKEK